MIHKIAFSMFENKTRILEINNIKLLFIKLSFVKTSMQIIPTINCVNFYFSTIYNTHCRILSVLIPWACPAPGFLVVYLVFMPCRCF